MLQTKPECSPHPSSFVSSPLKQWLQASLAHLPEDTVVLKFPVSFSPFKGHFCNVVQECPLGGGAEQARVSSLKVVERRYQFRIRSWACPERRIRGKGWIITRSQAHLALVIVSRVKCHLGLSLRSKQSEKPSRMAQGQHCLSLFICWEWREWKCKSLDSFLCVLLSI